MDENKTNLGKKVWSHLHKEVTRIIEKSMMTAEKANLEIVRNKTYHLADNDWYLVEEDDRKMMLVDTDCKVAGEELGTAWSNYDSANGQCILDFTNVLVDKYFAEIKYAIIPRDVNCQNKYGEGHGKIKGAYMWPLSYDEFDTHQDIGCVISQNAYGGVWTRTFESYDHVCLTLSHHQKHQNYRAWYVGNAYNKLIVGTSGVKWIKSVAPAFYLDKSKIERITEDGEIILKPASEFVTTDNFDKWREVVIKYEADLMDTRQQGLSNGILGTANILLSMNMTVNEICSIIVKQYDISEKEAEDFVNKAKNNN